MALRDPRDRVQRLLLLLLLARSLYNRLCRRNIKRELHNVSSKKYMCVETDLMPVWGEQRQVVLGQCDHVAPVLAGLRLRLLLG